MVEPSKGNTPGTQQPEPVSTQQRRIAVLARPPVRADQRVRTAAGLGDCSERTCHGRNRMREIRTSGSVRGEGGNLLAYSTAAGVLPVGIPQDPSILSFFGHLGGKLSFQRSPTRWVDRTHLNQAVDFVTALE